ncbi:MAG TPA: substrate-binding domain-containing protein [Opitutaceae bacterium]|nr:substrate-binding domain-containing protein [Opitutaceae bacterium]
MRKRASTPAATPPFRVQLVVDTHLAYFREVILGVRKYGFETGRLELVDRWLEHEPRDLRILVQRDNVQGIIAAIHRPNIEARFSGLGIPVVNTSNTMPLPRLPVVTQDDRMVGRLAGEHLRDCGCRRFAFWGQQVSSYTFERLEGFRGVVEKNGATVDVRLMPPKYGRPEYTRILRWLSRQQRPLGVFAVLDAMGLLLLRAARELGWRVPEDLAVLGAGDDDFLVAFERIALSSVKLPARQIGYAAAQEIDRLICGGSPAREGIRLPPAGLAARQSTDTLFVTDEVVVRALQFIRQRATSNPYVSDVSRFCGVSIPTLQARFRATLGRTVLAEIQRVRIERAKEFLRTTDSKLEQIAENCGFPNAKRFSVLFRQLSGTSPRQFRRSSR